MIPGPPSAGGGRQRDAFRYPQKTVRLITLVVAVTWLLSCGPRLKESETTWRTVEAPAGFSAEYKLRTVYSQTFSHKEVDYVSWGWRARRGASQAGRIELSTVEAGDEANGNSSEEGALSVEEFLRSRGIEAPTEKRPPGRRFEGLFGARRECYQFTIILEDVDGFEIVREDDCCHRDTQEVGSGISLKAARSIHRAQLQTRKRSCS